MFKENNTLVSQYDNALSRVPNDVFVFNELNRIKNGFYKTAIEVCRSYLDIDKIDEYKKNKSNLPAITFSGTFTGSHKKENLNSFLLGMLQNFHTFFKMIPLFSGCNMIPMNLSNFRDFFWSEQYHSTFKGW